MISAIITTYKRPPEIIKRAAESVLNQTYKDLELIIVDDSPSDYELRDAVKDMVISLGDRVTYIAHEKNQGACAARNTGLKNSCGEFVAFLDDDDEWLPEKIEKQLVVMNENPEVALVYCGRYTFFAEENREELQKVKFYEGYIFDKLILDNFIGSTSFPLIRKSAIMNLGGFDVSMPAAQDFEMWLRIAAHYKIGYVEAPLVRYYVHEGDQITKNTQRKADALKRLSEKNIDYLKKHKKAYGIRLLRLSCVTLSFDREKAKDEFKSAIRIYPFLSVDLLKAFKWIYIMPALRKE